MYHTLQYTVHHYYNKLSGPVKFLPSQEGGPPALLYAGFIEISRFLFYSKNYVPNSGKSFTEQDRTVSAFPQERPDPMIA